MTYVLVFARALLPILNVHLLQDAGTAVHEAHAGAQEQDQRPAEGAERGLAREHPGPSGRLAGKLLPVSARQCVRSPLV